MTARITGSEARALLNAAHDDGCPPECSGSCVGATLRLNAHGRDLALAVVAITEERDAIDADREALAMGVWHAVHDDEDGTPSLDTPRDRAAVIAAVRALRDEMEHLRSCVALGVAAMDDVAARVWCAVHGTATPHPRAPRDAVPLAEEVNALRRERDHLRSACDRADAEVERLRASLAAHARTGGAP